MQVPLIGADPEIFLKKNGEIISAIGLVGGSKEKPLPVRRGALQEDNVLAEFNIDPAATEDDFVINIATVMEQLERKVSPCVLEIKPSHTFDMNYLIMQGPSAMASGCDPDYDCWTGKRNTPAEYSVDGLRAAGGHIHIGLHGVKPHIIARAMDMRVGAMFVQYDNDIKRRTRYGRSGAFRPKPYGSEYRVLSNVWLQTEMLTRLVYRASIEAMKHLDTVDEDLKKIGGLKTLRTCINKGDIELSKMICDKLGVNAAYD